MIRVVTYNVHGCKGCDLRVAADRPLRVLERIDADVIALQEFVDGSLPTGKRLLEHWADTLGMRGVYAPAFVRGGELFGNALLTRFEIVAHRNHDMSIRGFRRRTFLEVGLRIGAVSLQMMIVHLGLSAGERARQAGRIEEMSEVMNGDVQMWVGDFNEWRPRGVISRTLNNHFASSPPVATFPAIAPFLPLDRIWLRPGGHLIEVRTDRSRAAMIASDHLPLIATLSLPARGTSQV